MGIGSILLDQGLIGREQLDEALAEQRTTGERLDRIIVRMGWATPEQVLGAIGEHLHMPVVDLTALDIDEGVLAILPAKLVTRQNCVPIARDNGTLTVATSDPFELAVLDELKLLTGCSIRIVLADEHELRSFIHANYGVGSDTLDELSAGMEDEVAADSQDELAQAQEASVIKLVNDLLIEAVKDRATDVHIEPYERELVVRYRIDGVLQRANVPPSIHRFGAAIVSRIKIMATMNIAEKRRPQDGRITIRHKGQEFDLRVSVIPMLFGEGVVLRILSKSAALMPLTDLGMPQNVLTRWDKLIRRPHGILLVTGPTGSGKSTTLYASLNTTVSDKIKVITIEDPVEYHVTGVNQIQVSGQVGLSFAAGLRSVLRHDPDVVMVGEIRDRETAEVAVQASLTGHLVLSTLHTNDASGAITRLIDMGVEPFLVASSLEGVLAQRLVRRVCPECLEMRPPDPAEVPTSLGLDPDKPLAHATGCRQCRNTGYKGRLGVYELLSVSDHLREMVVERVSSPEIASYARGVGDLTTLHENGLDKVRQGVTTVEEVLRALAS